jgi:tetratricopeptide (TPR) repeat protein
MPDFFVVVLSCIRALTLLQQAHFPSVSLQTLRMKKLHYSLLLGLLCLAPATHAQNQQIWGTYWDQCAQAKNRSDSTAVCTAAYQEAEKFGANSSQMGDTENLYGIIFVDMGRYQDALLRYQRTLAIRERIASQSNNGTEMVAETLHNLGIVYRHLNRLPEAEQSYRRSLALKEQVLGASHKSVGQSLNNLANVLKDQGKATEAQAVYLRSIAIAERTEPNSIALANAYDNLGGLLAAQNQTKEALQYREKALQLRKAILPH